jgi:hypothetical protein
MTKRLASALGCGSMGAHPFFFLLPFLIYFLAMQLTEHNASLLTQKTTACMFATLAPRALAQNISSIYSITILYSFTANLN